MKERLLERFYGPPFLNSAKPDQHKIIRVDGFVKTGE